MVDNIVDKSKVLDDTKNYHSFINSIAQVIWETDASGMVVDDSPSWRAYTGQTYEEYAGYGWFDAIHPDDRAYAEKWWEEAVNELKSFNVELRLKSPNGKWKWTNIIASPIFDSCCNLKKWAAINIDICERKSIEIDLKPSEELYQKIIRAANQGVAITDNKGIISFVNEAHAKWLGYSANEMIGRDGSEFVAIENSRTCEGLLENRKAGISEIYDIKTRKKDGSCGWVSINATPIYDDVGDYMGSLAFSTDITHRKEFEQNLIAKEQEYREIIDESIEGSLVGDFEKNELYYSNEWKKRLGIEHISPKEAIGITSSLVHPDDIKYVNDKLATALEKKLTNLHREFRIKTVDSGYIWILAKAKIIYNKEGKPIKYFCSHMDIDERKKREINLEQLLKAQDEVFANISHELKTPLSVIFSANQLLEMYLRNNTLDKNKDKVVDSLHIIKQNCYRFTKIINNVVDLSKLESGFLKAQIANEDIVLIVKEIVESVDGYVKQKDLSIEFTSDVKVKIMAFDSYKIERVILNLISNAVKFTNPGGKISVKLKDNGNNIIISVADTGIGLENKYLKSIFKRYNQVDKSLSRNAEGSGIGLSLVKSIVELHNGKISVESTVGKGTTFNINLPVKTVRKKVTDIYTKSMNNKIDTLNIEFSDIYSI